MAGGNGKTRTKKATPPKDKGLTEKKPVKKNTSTKKTEPKKK